LAQVAKMGFKGFEFAGYYKYQNDAKGLRQKLDDLGVKASGTHISTGVLRGDALKQTIEFHQTLGCKYLIVPGDGDYTNPEKSKTLAETFNKAAETLKPLGMYCGFHNHTGEFKKDGDKTYFDLFAERTSKDVVIQIDCGWAFAAGFDPAELIQKNPGRVKTTHFKPTVPRGVTDKKAYIGQDSVDWVKVLAACRQYGGTEWVVVEQEDYPDRRPAMECTADSLAGLKKIW
jgi:sugar phosphate isomerase/epimerase